MTSGVPDLVRGVYLILTTAETNYLSSPAMVALRTAARVVRLQYAKPSGNASYVRAAPDALILARVQAEDHQSGIGQRIACYFCITGSPPHFAIGLHVRCARDGMRKQA